MGGGTLAFGATLRLHQRLVSVRAVPTRWVEVPKRCPQGAQKVPKRCPFPSCLHLCAQFFQFKAQCLVSLVFRIRRKHICKDKRSTCEKVLPYWFALQRLLFFPIRINSWQGCTKSGSPDTYYFWIFCRLCLIYLDWTCIASKGSKGHFYFIILILTD